MIHVGRVAPLLNMPAGRNAPANKGEVNMKLAPKILAASLFAATPLWLAGPVHAVPMGMGLGLKDAVTPAAETVRLGGGGRVGGGGGRVGGVGRPGGVGGVGRPGGIGGVGRPGGIGGVGGVGGVAGVGGPGRWNGAGRWNGGYWRPGYGLAAGAVGGAIAASSYYGGYGYDNYGYDNGYYGSGSGYADYCAQRFKSYDPASGTYLGYDGIRHPCP
jgi:hypothetical protein